MRHQLRIASHTSPDIWTEEQLGKLTLLELEYLCRLLGVSHSGTKSARIARLLDLGALRVELADFDEPEEIMELYTRKDLMAMAKRAGSYRWLAKRGIAAGLLNWRNSSRSKGRRFLAEMKERSAARPKQLQIQFTE